MSETKTKCTDCDGTGYLSAILHGFNRQPIPCRRCKASGMMAALMLPWIERGAWYKALRLRRDETLLAFSKRTGVSPGTVSDAERGIINPDAVLSDFYPTPEPSR